MPEQVNEACGRCGGTGYIIYKDDPSPPGVSLSPGSMLFSEPCPSCLGEGLCPKCGAALGGDEWAICPKCEWNEEAADKNLDVIAVLAAQTDKYDDIPF